MGALPLLVLSAVPVLTPQWRVAELPFGTVGSIATAADAPEIVYVSASDDASGQSGLFRSEDGGLHWVLLAEPLAGEKIGSVALDPQSASRLFATTFRGDFTPDPDAETRVYVSEDAGQSWQQRADFRGVCGGSFAFGGTDVDAVYLSLACSNELWASPDHGVTWTPRISPTTDSFGVVARLDGTLYAVSYEEIFRSQDGAASWNLIAHAPPDCPFITVFSPDEDEHVLVVGTGRARFGGIECGGMYRSQDSGRTWTPTLGNRYMTGIVRDPEIPARIFTSAIRVAGFFAPPGDLYQSDDDGRSWRSLAFPGGYGAFQVGLSADGRRLYAPPSFLPIRRPLVVPR